MSASKAAKQSRSANVVSGRVKVKTVPFEVKFTVRDSKKKNSSVDQKKLHFCRNDFLAIRNESGGFYLCLALQNVYNTTSKIKIQWLESVSDSTSTYQLGYLDTIYASSILKETKLKCVGKKKYLLSQEQESRIKLIVDKVNKGGLISDDDDSENESDGDDDEPAVKKSKSSKQCKKVGALKEKKKQEKSAKKPTKERQKKEKKPPRVPKRKKAAELTPRPNIKVLEKDPLMDTKENVPFVSASPHSKLVLRAVNLGDKTLLNSLVTSPSTICQVDMPHSVGYYVDAIQLAFLRDDPVCLKVLCTELNKPTIGRIAPTSGLMTTQSTGRYNKLSLGGVPNVRKVALSRGSREGNNAFTKDLSHGTRDKEFGKYVDFALRNGVSKKTLDVYVAINNSSYKSVLYEKIVVAVRCGHRKLAGELIEETLKTGSSSFGFLHKEVLLFDNENLRPGLKAISVKKKTWDNGKITPIHCAAINPNPKYLKALLNILPEYGIVDAQLRRPIHYAAACEGTGPLELLLNRSIDPNDVDSYGMAALHIACDTGRAHNVELLLKKANEAVESNPKDAASSSASTPTVVTAERATEKKRGKKAVAAAAAAEVDDETELQEDNWQQQKYGIGGVNRPIDKVHNKHYGYCPLHLAANKGFIKVMEVLLKYGAKVDAELNASKDKLTPLMVACSTGHLDAVRLLIKHGANALKRDKLNRTALTHAAMSGHAHIVSYLLNLGVEIDQQDTSGNTPLHYAVGYGWYFCTKMLLDAGADAVILNDWKTTPLAVAYLKGHTGLADLLLEQPNVDINFRLDSGMTLVSVACASPLVHGIVDQIKYLVVTKHADCSLTDDNGANPLHHLASNNVYVNDAGYGTSEPCVNAMNYSIKIAKLLIKNGCDLSAVDQSGFTPVMYSIQQRNFTLAKHLLGSGSDISVAADKKNRNVLHLLAEQCMQQSVTDMLQIISKKVSDPSKLTKMAQMVDDNGYTPLLRACYQYREWPGSVTFLPGEYLKVDIRQATYEDKKDAWRAAFCDFFECLIKLCSPSLTDVIQPVKDLRESEKLTRDMYSPNKVAAFSCLHLLASAGHEVEGRTSALTVLLNFLDKSDVKFLNAFNMDGRTALMLALDGSNDRINALLAFGVDVNLKSKNKEEDGYATALILAAKRADDDVIEILLENGAKANDIDCYGRTALHHVLFRGNSFGHGCFESSVENLIKSGADVNACDPHKRMSLHYLVKYSRLQDKVEALSVARHLIKAGAKVNACDKKQRTPLHLAVNGNSGASNSSTAMEILLLENGANPMAADCRKRLPLHYVFTKIGHRHETSAIDPVELCSTLTGSTEKPQPMTRCADKFGRTPLHLACRRGAGVCAIHLVTKGADKNACDSEGNSPLSLAVLHKHESCTMLLMQQNVNINVKIFVPPKSNDDVNKKKTVEKKKKNEADDSDNSDSDDDENMKDTRQVEFDEENDDDEEPDDGDEDDDDEEPDDGDEDDDDDDARIKKKIVKKELKVKNKPAWKWSPIKRPQKPAKVVSYSAFQGVVANEWQGVMFMMCDVIDVFKVSMATVVQAALVTNKYHLAKVLIRKPRQKNDLILKLENGQNLAHIMAKTSSPSSNSELVEQVAEALLNKGVDFNADDDFGCTPLHYACLQCCLPLMRFILEKCPSVDVNKKDKFGYTPLAAAFKKIAIHGYSVVRVAEELFRKGSSFDVLALYQEQRSDVFGHTVAVTEDDFEEYAPDKTGGHKISPLIHAIIYGNFEIVRALVNDGASINFTDEFGRTPLMVAVIENKAELVRLLLDRTYTVSRTPESETDSSDDEDVSTPSSGRGKFKKQRSRQLFALGRQNVTQAATGNAAEPKKAPKVVIQGINMSCKIYPKKSNVDLKAIDMQGQNCLHYLIRPTGTHDDHQMLLQLNSAGAPPLTKQMDVLTKFLDNGLFRLSTAFQYIAGCKPMKEVARTYPVVSDGLTWTTPSPSFREDATEFLRQHEEDANNMDVDFVAEPDFCLGQGTWEVMTSEANKRQYDILLFKIDVRHGPYGMYNFYKMQVVRQKGKDLFVLFTRWGRIGDTGMFQQTPFPDIAGASKEFLKIFRAKTGNDWTQLPQFEQKPGKYRLVPNEERCLGKKQKDFNLVLPDTKLPSKLHPYVQDLISELTDVSAYNSKLQKLNIDQSSSSIVRMSRQKLLEAKDVLLETRKVIDTIEEMRRQMPVKDMDAYMAELEKVAQLSNDYYRIIPRTGYEYERVPIIDSTALVEAHLRNVDTLLEMEVATKIMAGALQNIKSTNPLDYVYRCLNCKIELADEADVDIQYILCYAGASLRGKVEAVYRLSRDGENERLSNCGINSNRKLLFHGTGSCNLISILTRGLLIAPPEAAASGYRFGKGIYMADKFSKSGMYTWNRGGDPQVKFMLVCEAALGHSKRLYNGTSVEMPPGYDSILSLATNYPDPKYDITLQTGVVIPLGSLTNKHSPHKRKDGSTWYRSSGDHEYVVYNESQVALRYLIQYTDDSGY